MKKMPVRKLSIIGGMLVFLVGGFFIGYEVGKTPTTDEVMATSDMTSLLQKQNQIYGLCERKYQLGIAGKFDDALEVKGQMKLLQTEIDGLLSKYRVQTL